MRHPVLSLAALISWIAPAVFAATFVVPTDDEMIRRADAIVLAVPTDQKTQLTAAGGIETVTTFNVTEVLKGVLLPGTLDVHEAGGTLGDRTTKIEGVPEFQIGRRALLFLSLTPSGTWAATDLVLGSFSFANDANGVALLVREEIEINGWDPDGTPHFEHRRDAAAFLDYIRSVVAGRPANKRYEVPAILPIVKGPMSIGRSTTTAPLMPVANYTAASYMMSCGQAGCRWSVFPNAVNWYNQNTEPGAPNGGISAFQSGLASWTNDCGSNVNYQYAGTNTAATGGLSTPDGVNAIMFEVSLSAYGASPYNCATGGTIAIGGVTSASGTNTSPSGETFATTHEADVAGNIGLSTCPTFLSSGDFVTALTHELGHTLGFRHSNECPTGGECSSTAVMNSVIVSGLNGALQQWDVDAVRTVYPGGSCTSPPPTTGSGVKGDFNGDGKPDIVLRNYTTGQNAVWFMNGTSFIGTADLPALTNTSWRIEGTGDFNGDGKTDILWRNYSTGQNAVWLMNGTSLGSVVDLPALTNLNMHIAGTGDFNKDGKPDILWRNYSTGQDAIWIMNGTAFVGVVDLPQITNTSYHIESSGDFNGDGNTDIVLRNYATGQNAVWLMNGVNFSSIADLPALPNTAYHIGGVADFTGEGKPDIVWRDMSTGQDAIWVMNGLALASVADLPALTNTAYEINGPR